MLQIAFSRDRSTELPGLVAALRVTARARFERTG